MKLSEFAIHLDGRVITCLLGEPDAGSGPGAGALAADPAIVLNFASDRRTTLCGASYDIPSAAFVEAGHRTLSFDLPHHGDRVGSWSSREIEGFCEALLAGVDPFEVFVADGRAAIDAVLARGLARPGRVFLAGTSRGGYCALRLAAADRRVAGVAAYAPVTDWRVMREFEKVRDRPAVAALALEHFAATLAGRPIYIAIGNADTRVGSDRCAEFAACLLANAAAQGLTPANLCFHVVDGSTGHSLADVWRHAGADFLLRQMGT